MKRDSVWEEMAVTARQLSDRYCEQDTVKVFAHRVPALLTVSEGLAFGDRWTEGFQPVRRRRVFGSRWTQIQTVAQAADHVETFLRERPDLAVFDR